MKEITMFISIATLARRLYAAVAVLLFALFIPAAATANCTAGSIATQANAIAHGHAFTKHHAEFVKNAVFDGLAFPDDTIANADEFGAFIGGIMSTAAASRALAGNRTAYWDARTGTVVILNLDVNDCGTAFRPVAGMAYYNNLN
jgi:hypothetical protein